MLSGVRSKAQPLPKQSRAVFGTSFKIDILRNMHKQDMHDSIVVAPGLPSPLTDTLRNPNHICHVSVTVRRRP